MKVLSKYLGMAMLAAIMLLVAACGGNPATSTPVPPTNTVPQPTNTAAQPTTAPTSAATSTTGSTTSSTDYKTYTASTGNWSIDYPSDWTVNTTGPSTQFLGPQGGAEAFAQVTYSDVGAKLPVDQLVQIAGSNLKTGFGDSYVESKQEQQADGSTRIDFTFSQGTTKYSGQTFVEQRGTGLYLLMLVAQPSMASKYDPIFQHIVQSYKLPADTGGTTAGGTATTGTTDTATATAGSTSSNVTYKTFTATTGNWSIDYPADWTVNATGPSTQFLGPQGGAQAFGQVTYTDVGATVPADQLVQIAGTNLKSAFGDSYVQTNQSTQPDGSTRIDFTFSQGTIKYSGHTFVEQRGTNLYLLMLVSDPSMASTYEPIFDHMVQTYKLPAK